MDASSDSVFGTCIEEMLGTAGYRCGRPVLRVLEPAVVGQYHYGDHGDAVQYEPLGELTQNVKSVNRDYGRGAEVVANANHRDHVYPW